MKNIIFAILLFLTSNLIQLHAQNLAYYDAKFKELPNSIGAYKSVLTGNIETIWHVTGEKFLEYTYKLEGDTLMFDTFTRCEYYKNGYISEKYNVVNDMYNDSFTTNYEMERYIF